MTIHKIRTKTTVIFLLIVLGLIFIGFDSHLFSQSACACLSINETVMHFLSKLNSGLQDSAKQHAGRFPSYAEFTIISADLLPELNGKPYPVLSQVNMEQRGFSFIPGEQDIYKNGYAIAPDQKNYALIGVGKTETYRSIRLFGIKLYQWKTGVEYPVLQPGDNPPPSPLE